jgi:hypothetical protein
MAQPCRENPNFFIGWGGGTNLILFFRTEPLANSAPAWGILIFLQRNKGLDIKKSQIMNYQKIKHMAMILVKA